MVEKLERLLSSLRLKPMPINWYFLTRLSKISKSCMVTSLRIRERSLSRDSKRASSAFSWLLMWHLEDSISLMLIWSSRLNLLKILRLTFIVLAEQLVLETQAHVLPFSLRKLSIWSHRLRKEQESSSKSSGLLSQKMSLKLHQRVFWKSLKTLRKMSLNYSMMLLKCSLKDSRETKTKLSNLVSLTFLVTIKLLLWVAVYLQVKKSRLLSSSLSMLSQLVEWVPKTRHGKFWETTGLLRWLISSETLSLRVTIQALSLTYGRTVWANSYPT